MVLIQVAVNCFDEIFLYKSVLSIRSALEHKQFRQILYQNSYHEFFLRFMILNYIFA